MSSRTIYADNENIMRVGRTFYKEGILWCGLSGSGIKFITESENVSIHFWGDSSTTGTETEGKARVAVYSDEVRMADFMMDEPEKEVELALDGKDKHEIRIVKLSECAMSMIGIGSIELSEGEIIKPEEKNFKIEFVGDSITCGYGADMEDPLVPFRTDTEDCTKAYAMKTARKLDADYSLVSYSGFGIISGYTNDDKKLLTHLVPPLYEKCGFSHAQMKDGGRIQDVDWDFESFRPQLVVVNLGTNDFSYTGNNKERLDDYVENYVSFLKVIKKHNPSAKILLTLGLMDAVSFENVERAAENYKKETGDEEVYTCEIRHMLPEDGLTSDYHPTQLSHEKASDMVVQKIKTMFKMQI